MTESAAAPEMVPAAALATMQDELASRDAAHKEELAKLVAESAAKSEQLALAEQSAHIAREEVKAAEEKSAALKALNAALELKKIEAEIRAEAVSKDANFSSASSKERHVILLDEGRDKSDAKRVPVGVNGRAYDLARGVPVEVPQDVISVLNDAVIGRAESIVDERTGVEAGVRYVAARRFPFTYLGRSVDPNGTRLLTPEGKPLTEAA